MAKRKGPFFTFFLPHLLKGSHKTEDTRKITTGPTCICFRSNISRLAPNGAKIKETLFFLISTDNKILSALTRCEPEPLSSSKAVLETEEDSSSPDTSAKRRKLRASQSPTQSSPSLPASPLLLSALSDLCDRELVATIGWAKQIPGKEKYAAF